MSKEFRFALVSSDNEVVGIIRNLGNITCTYHLHVWFNQNCIVCLCTIWISNMRSVWCFKWVPLPMQLTLAEDAHRAGDLDSVYMAQRNTAQYFEQSGDTWLSDHFYNRCLETGKLVRWSHTHSSPPMFNSIFSCPGTGRQWLQRRGGTLPCWIGSWESRWFFAS